MVKLAPNRVIPRTNGGRQGQATMMFGWDGADDAAVKSNQTSKRARLVAIIACAPVLAGLVLLAFFVASRFENTPPPGFLAPRP